MKPPSGVLDQDPKITAFYELGREKTRLHKDGKPNLELVRTLELLERLLPPPPARILDVGGGPGTYACLLVELGYTVKVIDASARHVDEAVARGANRAPAFTAECGDARRLAEPDQSWDAVLLLGPLYHLTARDERREALAEARRVVRAGGVILALGIPRYHSFLDGIRRGVLSEPVFNEIAWSGYRTGIHTNPEPKEHPEWFTTAYFHYPEELAAEMTEQGISIEAIYSVLAVGFLAELRWHELQDTEQAAMLEAIRSLECEPGLIGLSDFLIAGKPS